MEVSNYFSWLWKNTFIDYPTNDPFGKKVDIVSYPQPTSFNVSIYSKRIEYIKSYIHENNKNMYVIIIKENNRNKIISKLIDVINKNKNKCINIFIENIMNINIFSHFPKIWYKNNVYLEIYRGNILFGYIKIKYVNYDFIINKEYNKYKTIIF